MVCDLLTSALDLRSCPRCGGDLVERKASRADERSLFAEASDCREAAGVPIGNTDPAKHRKPNLPAFDPDATRSGGIDYLEITVWGYYEPVIWDDLRAGLEAAQEFARAGDEERAYISLLGGEEVKVKPAGFGKGWSRCRWAFDWQGLTFGIVDCCDSYAYGEQKRPHLFITVPSMVLMERGEAGAHDLVQQILRGMGHGSYRMSASRADACVDLVDVEPSEFQEHVTGGRAVTRAAKTRMHATHGRLETLEVGAKGAPVMLRIYDKLEECRDDPAKLDVMITRRWGHLPRRATRVEFQLRREHLRELHSVRDLDELFTKLRSIIDYLTGEWFRLTEAKPVKGHTKEAKVSPLWQRVIDAFHAWVGSVQEVRHPARKIAINPTRLYQQMRGCLVSALAGEGELPETPLDALMSFVRFMERTGFDVTHAVAARRRDLEARLPDIILQGGDTPLPWLQEGWPS